MGDNEPKAAPASTFEGHKIPEPAPTTWLEEFDAREQKSIDHARLYAAHYAHGDPGHLHLMIIAKLAALLDRELIGAETEYVVQRSMVDRSS